MREILIQEDVKLVKAKLQQFEAATGCELLLIVSKSSDPYPGASWRFGIVGGFLMSLIVSYYLEFQHSYYWPVAVLLITLLMTWVGHFPWAKRMSLSSWEVDRECMEKSIEYFHTMGTSKVSHKVTAMIMVSVLERKIMVLVDEFLKSKITQEELNDLVNIMKKHFKDGNMALGFTQSINSLEEKILKDFGGKVSQVNPAELLDTIHFL
ncbi:MAG TPA: TPM domain-containing protein [Bacteriovoracaceae bacterium]|nr:TPM domain-containing protein [Bacteriovoracaceae bacterium]